MKRIFTTFALTVLATSAASQHAHGGGAALQVGQAQFAAIAEITGMLRSDPDTDWGRVNIAALRAHLVDMDNVTSKATVETVVSGLEVLFRVSGTAPIDRSIRNMVLAHGPMLQQATGWGVTTQKTAGGATMSVQANTLAEVAQIAGLGFFGVMTVGAHHQQHHLMIAKGHDPH